MSGFCSAHQHLEPGCTLCQMGLSPSSSSTPEGKGGEVDGIDWERVENILYEWPEMAPSMPAAACEDMRLLCRAIVGLFVWMMVVMVLRDEG